MQRGNHTRGALLAVGSALLFAAAGAGVKQVSATLPNTMVVFFRNAFALAVLAPWLARSGVSNLATPCLRLHLTRTLCGLAAMYCFFYAISRLHLAEAVLLNYTAPLFIPFLASLWLDEPIPHRAAWPIVLGFAGIALILKPTFGFFSAAGLIGLAGGVLSAAAFVGIRGLTREEPTARIVFYFTTISTVVSSIPLVWGWSMPDARTWAVLVAIGALAAGGQLLMTSAYSQAPAAWIGPFSYSTVVFAAFFGWILWGEVLDALSVAGAGLVCAAGILSVRATGGRTAAAADEPLTEPSPALDATPG
jgi:drug/metabolite transporter (DMT)-like permease